MPVQCTKQGRNPKRRGSTSEGCGVLDLANDIRTLSLSHLEPYGSLLASREQILSDEDGIPGLHRGCEGVVIHRQHFRRSLLVLVGSEDDLLSFHEFDRCTFLIHHVELRSDCIQHHGAQPARVLDSPLQILQSLLMVILITPWEVEASHGHPRIQHGLDTLHGTRLRSQSPDYLSQGRKTLCGRRL